MTAMNGELIRREDAMAYPLAWDGWFNPNADNKFMCGVETYRDWIAELPSVDAVEVVHGEWIDFNWEVGGDGIATELCGKCGQWSYGMGKKYCPHCGAKNGGE